MSNFGKKLQDASDEELYQWINELNYQVVPLASDELTRRDLIKLNVSIDEMNKSTGRYSDALIVLTIVLCVIGMLQLAAVIFPVPDSWLARYVIFGICIALIAWAFWQGVRDWRPKDD